MVFWMGRTKRRDCKKKQQQQRGGASSNADATLSSSESSSPLDKKSKKSLKRQTSNKKELNDLVALAAVRVMSRVRQDAANPSIEAFCPNHQGQSRWASPAVPQLPPNEDDITQSSPPLTFDQARSLNTVASGVTWDSLYSYETASLYSHYFLQRDKEDKIVRKYSYDNSFDEGFASDGSDDAVLLGCHALWCA